MSDERVVPIAKTNVGVFPMHNPIRVFMRIDRILAYF